MIHYLVTVHDTAADAYGRVFPVTAKGLAVRHFVDEVNRNAYDNPMFKHFGQFNLFCVGHFDDGDGSVVCISPPELLMAGVNAKADDHVPLNGGAPVDKF